MSYTINKTDGSVLTEIVDGTIDQTATDLTLIGKNSTSYGEYFNENFVHLLENFANNSQPNNPIQGQLWYDTSEGRVKVYDGNGWKVSGGTIVSSSAPSSISQGDIWIDSFRRQMYFNDGVSTLLAGPIYTEQQGISGFQVTDILDTSNNSHTVIYFYLGASLLGIFAKESFTPATAIPGFAGTITPGFNQGTISGLQFKTTAQAAYNLIDSFGNLKTVENFVLNDQDSAVNGTISILNTTPLKLGPATQNEFLVSNTLCAINSNRSNQNFKIGVKNVNGLRPGVFIDTLNERVGIFTDTPIAALDVTGSVRITGDLTVEGSLTTINTTNLQIEDLLIELGKVDSPSNSTANGGGILLEAGLDGDKTITWTTSNTSWNSSEHFNLAVNKSYKINGFDVLNQTTLGSTVVNAPGLTSIGTQTNFYAGTINITSNTISSTQLNGSIILAPAGSGTLNLSAKRISNLGTPSSSTDAATKGYVDTQLSSKSLGLSADTTGLANQTSAIASSIIEKVFPVIDYQNGTLCRIHCINGGVRTNKLYSVVSGVWTYNTDI